MALIAQVPVSDNMEKKGSQKKKIDMVECSIHPEEFYSNFCDTCNTLVCPSCLVEDHQMHHFQKITDVHKDQIKQIDKFKEHIQRDLLSLLTKRVEKLSEIQQLHTKKYEEGKLKILQQDAFLKEEITKKTNRLLADLEKAMKITQNEILEEKTRIEYLIKDLIEKMTFANDATLSNNIETVCNASLRVENSLKEVTTSFSILPLVYKDFVVGKVTDARLAKAVGTLQNKLLHYQADFQVQQSYETDFVEIGSLSACQDGTLWISDFWGEFSKKIHHIAINEEITIIKEKQLQLRSYVAATKSGEVLITSDKDSDVKILTKDGSIKNFRSFSGGLIRGSLVPTALHVTQNNQVVMSVAEKDYKYSLQHFSSRKVIVLNIQGKELACLEFDRFGKRFFTLPFRISSNKHGDMLSIIDRLSFESGRIVTLDTTGKLLWIYEGSHKKTFDPSDIVTTSRGNMIILDISNKSLHILNSDGQLIQYQPMETLGIQLKLLPSMAIDSKGQLFITCGSQIHVLKFTGC